MPISVSDMSSHRGTDDIAVAGPSSLQGLKASGLAKHDQQPPNYSTASSGGTLTHAHTSQPANSHHHDTISLYSFNSARDIRYSSRLATLASIHSVGSSQFVRDCFGRMHNNLNDAYLLPSGELTIDVCTYAWL
jgi:hypothetical protein